VLHEPIAAHMPNEKLDLVLFVFCDVAPRSLAGRPTFHRCLQPPIIALIMQAVSTFEMSVSFCETARRNIPEDSNVFTRCLENVKSRCLNLAPNPQTGGPHIVGCPRLFLQYIRSNPPSHLQVVSSSAT
jgi:hypothetical protein